MLRADLTDYGQVVEALAGADAVVHLANIPAPGLSTAGGHLQRQHHHELQRLPGCREPSTEPGGVGVQRDHPRPAVPRAAAVRAGGRGPLPGADEHLRAVQGGQRDDRRAIAEWSGIPYIALRFPTSWPRRTTSGSPRSGRCTRASEPVGVHRRAHVGHVLPPRPRGPSGRSFKVTPPSSSRPRTRHEPPVGGAAGRGAPRCPATRDVASSAPCWPSTAPGRSSASSPPLLAPSACRLGPVAIVVSYYPYKDSN